MQFLGKETPYIKNVFLPTPNKKEMSVDSTALLQTAISFSYSPCQQHIMREMSKFFGWSVHPQPSC